MFFLIFSVLQPKQELTGFPFCSPWCRASQSKTASRPWRCSPARLAGSHRGTSAQRAAAHHPWGTADTAARSHSTSSAASHHCLSENYLRMQTKAWTQIHCEGVKTIGYDFMALNLINCSANKPMKRNTRKAQWKTHSERKTMVAAHKPAWPTTWTQGERVFRGTPTGGQFTMLLFFSYKRRV